MLQYLRNASNSIAMKIVFGLIMFGFCMWGVGDIIRNYQASRSVMKIGEHSITVGHFLNEFNTIKQEILRQEVIGEKVNINVKDATIRKLIAEYSFESMVERLKLTVSKNTMLELAKSMPEFQVDGQFNPGMYIDRLRASGMNEHMFLNYLRKNILRTQLVMPVVLSFQIPEFVKNRLKKKYSMQKTMQIWTISPKDIKQNIRVTEEDVKEYYASHPDKYQIP